MSPQSNRKTSTQSAVNLKKKKRVTSVSDELEPTILLTYYLEYDRHVVQLRCRRRLAYRPTSNTVSHDNHEKINSWVSFSFPYEYGAPFDGFAIIIVNLFVNILGKYLVINI